MSVWYKLVDRKPVPASHDDMEEIFDEDTRRVGNTELPNGGRVSTVFLGLDHAFGGNTPVLFESMYFPDPSRPYEDDCERYCTWQEAVEGHRRMVLKYGGTADVMDEELFEI